MRVFRNMAALQMMVTLYACAVSVRSRATRNGSLLLPESDKWLCDDLIPPGMEDKPPESSFIWYLTLTRWVKIGKHYAVATVVHGSEPWYTFIGYILQGKTDNVPNGFFLTTSEFGYSLICGNHPAVSCWFVFLETGHWRYDISDLSLIHI